MSKKMKVVAIVGDHQAEPREVTKDTPSAGQVLVQIKACALCTFEQRMFTRVTPIPLPFVGGHEVAGVIAGVGVGVDDKLYAQGKKVALRLLTACGECYYCRHDQQNLCVSINAPVSNGREIPGTDGLSEFIAVDASKVYFLPDDASFETAVFAEPLACVVNSIEKGQVEMGDDVVILGGGIMGMLHVLCAKRKGARVIMSEPDAKRRDLALEMGADLVVDPSSEDPVAFVKALSGRGADVVFNTTPVATVAEQAVQMTSYMGRCVMYSSMHPDKPIEVSPNWLHKSEAIITGAVSPTVRSFDRAVAMLGKGIIDPSKLVSGVFTADEAQQAFDEAIRPETFRIIVTF